MCCSGCRARRAGAILEVSGGIQQTFDLIQEGCQPVQPGVRIGCAGGGAGVRKIQLGVKTKGLVVRARDRYWARP